MRLPNIAVKLLPLGYCTDTSLTLAVKLCADNEILPDYSPHAAICHKKGPIEDEKISYDLRRHTQAKLV